MATTTARNQQDVDNMSKKDRLWDSLNYSYGLKREDSDKAYDKAYSQADRQALGRGMQRSSYNAQNLANINQQKIDAQNRIWDTQIADYENRLGDIEQQELENERWERQYADSRADTAWNQAFQEKQYQAGRDDAAWNKEFQTRQYNDTRADAERNWNFTQQQYADSRADTAWQQGMTEKQYADSRADTAWNQAFQTQQFELQKEQWQKEFGFNEKTTEQKIAMEYAMSILQNGQMPSADLLARAGLSNADAQSMMAQAKSGDTPGSKTPQVSISDEAAKLAEQLKNKLLNNTQATGDPLENAVASTPLTHEQSHTSSTSGATPSTQTNATIKKLYNR